MPTAVLVAARRHHISPAKRLPDPILSVLTLFFGLTMARSTDYLTAEPTSIAIALQHAPYVHGNQSVTHPA